MKEAYRTMYEEILALLRAHAADRHAYETIAPMVAEKSLEMNHLYQDLGLPNRIEMGKFMKKHFPALAQKKPQETLWKKFLYDTIGKVAPACATCSDNIHCFACRID